LTNLASVDLVEAELLESTAGKEQASGVASSLWNKANISMTF
jgi:hypothetical protein